ncbi:right-handed parallel beta-helix repeat-containing protein [Cohnella ginsengisoli]|uniref:Right-handed parallel beta-helix repeat-containing protein n=1 Tax=Cohnella ginsengisoli TaxID=425004 RepID=A0A9X4KK73_9BACL|nr:right-handed parallel beta-helix repeat-containing protein [Cohnella ginsengisoli]MDG0791792.1 right-handed parallel beta-helix repeat-containing protein [Cohnella ginsengisoli]
MAYSSRKLRLKGENQIPIPEGADHFYLAFNQSTAKGAYFEYWNRTVSKDVVVTNSEFAFNRRQGITVGGADNVLISNSTFHDMKGTAPQSGIDVEGGFEVNGYFNSNITIQNNDFYNNAAYDVILFDGKGAKVEGNHLGSKGVIGLAVSNPFSEAAITDNHFDGTRLVAENDATFLGNTMNNSYTTISGPNIKIDGMAFIDSTLSVSSKVAFGVEISNVNISVSKQVDAGFTIWGQPIRVRNMTITGEPALRSITGGAAGGSIFENLKVIGYNAKYGISLSPGKYTGCQFVSGDTGQFGSISLKLKGSYVFDGCSFESSEASATNLLAEQPDLDLTIRNSTFELLGNTQAVSVQAAKSVVLENNTITAEHLSSMKVELIKINDYWKRNEKHDVKKGCH